MQFNRCCSIGPCLLNSLLHSIVFSPIGAPVAVPTEAPIDLHCQVQPFEHPIVQPSESNRQCKRLRGGFRDTFYLLGCPVHVSRRLLPIGLPIDVHSGIPIGTPIELPVECTFTCMAMPFATPAAVPVVQPTEWQDKCDHVIHWAVQ